MEREVNPSMITLARESRGFTQSALARTLRVTQGNISKIENDLLGISPDLLTKLSDELGYPESFFFEDAKIYPLGLHFYRKRKSIPKGDESRITAIANIRCFHLVKFLRSIDLPEIRMPSLDIDQYGHPGEVARALREYWMVPRGPIENVTRLIEDAGGIIVHCDFGTHKVDGFNFRVPALPPIIFINKSIPGDRMRFTLCHELGHITMHSIPGLDDEREADLFAAEFLMPAREIKHSLSNINLEKLAGLKLHWKVAMSALLMRANDLGRVTPRQYSYLWMQMGHAGYRTQEPAELTIPIEEPTLIREMLNLHLNELGYTAAELAKLLGLQEQELSQIYLEGDKRLRIVK